MISPAAGEDAWCGRAFGLRVTAPAELETLSACDAGGADRVVSWSRTADRRDLARDWSGEAPSRLLDYRFDDGRQMLAIDTDRAGSYLIESPGYGAHAVSADGTRITSLLPPDAPWVWQRLFVAQVLPVAAAIRGLEPLHASSVAFGGRAVAFSAPSGTGKTSLMLHLVARGATLVTDDILAIEPAADGITAHPGARLLNAAPHELAALDGGRERLGDLLQEADKVYLRPPVETEALPLVALYRVFRSAGTTELEFAEEAPPEPASVLGTVFLKHLRSPERLTNRLTLAAELARSVRVFNLQIPSTLSAQQLAPLLEAHVRERLGLQHLTERLG